MARVRALKWDAVLAQMRYVDDPDVLEKAAEDPALSSALEFARPRNWWGIGVEPARILNVAKSSGIPVLWVPPMEVLKKIVNAPVVDRMEVLVANCDLVSATCREVLDECWDEVLADSVYLLGRALDAFGDGHVEAAMSLAVSVAEPLAQWASVPRVQMWEDEDEQKSYEKLAKQEKYNIARYEIETLGGIPRLGRSRVQRLALIAPIPKFYTPFWPGDEEVPESLSRHVVAHQPSRAHFSQGNALAALMLGVSFIREQQEWCDEVRD